MPANTPDTDKSLIIVAGATADAISVISKLPDSYSVIFCDTADKALRGIIALKPDLLISSVSFPVDGIALLEAVKKDMQTSHLPVFLLPEDVTEEAFIERSGIAPDDFLLQPFTLRELTSRILFQIRKGHTGQNLERQIHSLFQQAPVAVSIFKGPGHVVEMVNESMLEIWGKSESEVLGKPLFTGMSEARDQGYEALLDSVLSTGERFVADERPVALLRNGQLDKIFVKFVFEPLYDENGIRSGIMTVAADITSQVEARKKIEESETRYKLATEAAEMGHFEWIIPTSEFIYSQRLAQIFGYSGTDGLVQSSFSDLIHPDDRQMRIEAHRSAMENGILFYEARIITPDGELRWVRLNGKVIYEDGLPAKMYGTALDITEHKRFSESLEKMVEDRTRSLRQSEERYQRMIGEVRDYAIILLDTNGTIMNWNQGAERIKGYHETEIIGKNFNIFYGEEDRRSQLPQKLISQAIMNGSATHEGYRVRKNGSKFWGSVAITALHDTANNIIGFSKVTRDLTERKQAEDKMMKYNLELEAQNRELEQFAYVASHDLQEPLRKIQMFTELLRQNTDDPELSAKYFEKITASASRMTELIKAVLNYSHLSRNEQQQFEDTDFKMILKGVLIDFELLIEERKAEITYDDLPVIKAIPLQINQLFSNLLGNSLKFTVSDPKIKINSRIVHYDDIEFVTNLRPDRKYLEVVFSDNGIGFDEKYLNKIFTIFHRLNDRSVYSGTGIGLALCKKIIENHSGFLTAKSAEGEGASFYIYLPVEPALKN